MCILVFFTAQNLFRLIHSFYSNNLDMDLYGGHLCQYFVTGIVLCSSLETWQTVFFCLINLKEEEKIKAAEWTALYICYTVSHLTGANMDTPEHDKTYNIVIY